MIRHISFLILTRAALAISGVVFWWLAARLYSVEQLGVAASLISACGFIWFLSECGVGAAVTRYWPDHADKGTLLGSLYGTVAVTFVLVALLFCLSVKHTVPALSFVSTLGGASMFFGLTLLLGVFQLSDTILIAAKHTHTVLFKNAAQYLLRIPLLLPCVMLGGWGIFAANCLSALLPLAALCWGYRYDIAKTKLTFAREELTTHAAFSGANFLGSTAASVPGLIFPLILSALFSPQEAGFFYIPWMMFAVMSSAVGAVTGMYAVESNHAGSLRPFFRKATLLGFGGALFCAVLFGLFGSDILGLFKKDFSEHSTQVLHWLCAALVPWTAVALYGIVQGFHKRTRALVVLNVSQIAVLVLAVCVFVPRGGAVGVAQAWCAMNVVVAMFLLFLVTWNALCTKRQYVVSFLS
jgi:O-antigen/teichoic acid export membrane protein